MRWRAVAGGGAVAGPGPLGRGVRWTRLRLNLGGAGLQSALSYSRVYVSKINTLYSRLIAPTLPRTSVHILSHDCPLLSSRLGESQNGRAIHVKGERERENPDGDLRCPVSIHVTRADGRHD